MKMEDAIKLAKDAGFEVAEPMDPAKLTFLPEVHDMCAENKCGQYNKRWTCPPACGTLEELKQKCQSYTSGVLFQTICRMEDEFDYEAMGESMEEMGQATGKLLDAIVALDEDIFPFGSDGCRNCKECTYPDAPCRFPERAFPSMEACGLMVRDVCNDNGVTYYYGKNTIAFTGGFLFNE